MSGAILVPLDGSDAAGKALPVADWLAERLDSELVLVTVLGDSGGEHGSRSSEPVQAHLDAAAAPLRAHGRNVRTDVRSGKPAEVIVEIATAKAVRMVVLTTFGAGGDDRHLGGTAERLSRTLTRPALFIPAAISGDRDPGTGPLLVALDGSATAEAALAFAQDLAQSLGMSMKLVRVAPWANELFAALTAPAPPSADEEIELGSNTYLAKLVERTPPAIDSDYQTLRGHPAEMLVEYVHDQNGVLVLSSHGHSASSLWHLGSTTDKVLRASAEPVLLVPVGRGP
jgi:nucleotide-binding universal stress UspA family protein